MTKPAIFDFTISENRALRRGAEFLHFFVFSYNIESMNFKAQIRDDNNVLIANIDVTKNDNQLLLRISKADLLLLADGSYYWDLRQNDVYIMRGDVDIITGVTQDGN